MAELVRQEEAVLAKIAPVRASYEERCETVKRVRETLNVTNAQLNEVRVEVEESQVKLFLWWDDSALTEAASH